MELSAGLEVLRQSHPTDSPGASLPKPTAREIRVGDVHLAGHVDERVRVLVVGRGDSRMQPAGRASLVVHIVNLTLGGEGFLPATG